MASRNAHAGHVTRNHEPGHDAPELALLGIKALIRIRQQTDKALIDYAADKTAPLADIEVFELTDKRDLLTKFLSLPRY